MRSAGSAAVGLQVAHRRRRVDRVQSGRLRRRRDRAPAPHGRRRRRLCRQGEGRGYLVEQVVYRRVDRRTPVGEPVAASVLELRVEEALRTDRPASSRTANVARAEPPSSRSAGGSAASSISSESPTRRAVAPCPSSARSETAGIPIWSPPAESEPSSARASTVALTSCCHRISRAERVGVGSSSISSGADTNP